MNYSFITDEVVKNFLSKASDAELQSMDPKLLEAINDKYKVSSIEALRDTLGVSAPITAAMNPPVHEPMASMNLLEDILVQLYDESKHLRLRISLKDKEIYNKKFGREPKDGKEWWIDNLGSGVSSAGDYYVSLALYTEDEEDGSLTYMELAVVIKKDGTYEIENFKPWSSEEGGTSAIFDAAADGFTYPYIR